MKLEYAKNCKVEELKAVCSNPVPLKAVYMGSGSTIVPPSEPTIVYIDKYMPQGEIEFIIIPDRTEHLVEFIEGICEKMEE